MHFPIDFALTVTIAVFLLAGMVKGLIGMGLPTIAMGLLAVIMPPAQAAAILVVPSFVTNVWQLFAGPAFAGLVRRLWSMMAGVVVGTIAGSGVLAGEAAGIATGGLGAALILYGLVSLSGLRFRTPSRHEAWLSPLIGAATGLVTGATGVFVIPAVPYLQSLGLEKDDLIQALGLSFTVSTVALAAGLLRVDAFQPTYAGISLLALVPALAGMFAGQWIREMISAETFRTVFFVGLLALGGYLLVRALV